MYRALGALFLLAVLPLSADASVDADGVERISAPQSTARNTHVPLYQTLRPMWGLEFTGGFAMPSGAFSFLGGALRFEWQPPWIQAAGVLSIGPALDYSMGVTGFGAGGVVRYQARYFREQPVVPMGGYTALYYLSMPSLGSGLSSISGSLVHGPFAGAYVLLNFIEPDASAEFYVDHGVLRTYLVAEVRFLQGAPSSTTTVSSVSYYAGLRFEF